MAASFDYQCKCGQKFRGFVPTNRQEELFPGKLPPQDPDVDTEEADRNAELGARREAFDKGEQFMDLGDSNAFLCQNCHRLITVADIVANEDDRQEDVADLMAEDITRTGMTPPEWADATGVEESLQDPPEIPGESIHCYLCKRKFHDRSVLVVDDRDHKTHKVVQKLRFIAHLIEASQGTTVRYTLCNECTDLIWLAAGNEGVTHEGDNPDLSIKPGEDPINP